MARLLIDQDTEGTHAHGTLGGTNRTNGLEVWVAAAQAADLTPCFPAKYSDSEFCSSSKNRCLSSSQALQNCPCKRLWRGGAQEASKDPPK